LNQPIKIGGNSLPLQQFSVFDLFSSLKKKDIKKQDLINDIDLFEGREITPLKLISSNPKRSHLREFLMENGAVEI
jgi:hypothetical protein